MRRALRRAGIAALLVLPLLVVLYAAAGTWLAPRLVRDALVEQAARLGLALEVGEVDTNPFLLTVGLADVTLVAQGRPLARAPRASADLAWASLWRGRWVVQELAVHEPWAELVLEPGGGVAWPRPEPPAPAPAQKRRALAVQRISLTDGTLHFVDRSRGAPVELTLKDVGLALEGLSTGDPAPARYEASASAAGGGHLSSAGTFSISPLSLAGRLVVADFALATLWRFAGPAGEALAVAGGALAVDGSVRFSADEAVFDGALAVREARFEERGSGAPLLAWQALETAQATLSFAPFGVELGEVRLQAPTGRLALDEDGRLNVARLLPAGEETEADPPPFTVERLSVAGGTLHFVDRSRAEPLELTAQALSGTLEGFSTAAPEARLELRAPRVVLDAGESFSAAATGTVAMGPFAADLQLELEGVPLRAANHWLPPAVRAEVTSGTLSAGGRLRLGEDDAGFRGAVALAEARIEERGSQALLLGWKRLETKEAALAFSPLALEIGELVAQAPSGRLVIGEEGRVNWAQVLASSPDDQDKAPFTATVRRLRIEDGALDFADRSLETDFAVRIAELSGTISGFGTAPGDPARVRLAGRVGEYGAVRIRGAIDLEAPKSMTSLTAGFRNLDLAALTPYVVRFAGYRVESGRVSAELRYRVREGRLVGDNDLAFEEVELGERVEQAGVKDLPLELALALLTDAQGRITLDIPVRGDLNDPQFDLGGLVARAIGNTIARVASAPFRALASVFGGDGRDLGEVRFAAGAAALSPPAEEDIANIARALAARPRLELSIAGGYDPQADAQALRRRAVRRMIAERAGVPPDAPLDFGDPTVLHAAENLYMQRAGSRLELQALRGGEKPYRRALTEALAATVPLAEPELAQLARARAETVRDALLARGVAPGRVALAEPKREDAGEEGVPTQLALRSEGRAAAGGTQ